MGKRIVLLIADNEDVNLIRGVESFIKRGRVKIEIEI